MLLLVAAALAGAPPADRAALWAGCFLTKDPAGKTHIYRCRSQTLSGGDLDYEKGSTTQHLDTFVAGLESTGVVLAAEVSHPTVGGVEVAQRTLRVPLTRAMVGTLTWNDIARKQTRVVLCTGLERDASASSSCAARTADVLANGWPAWLLDQPTTVTPMVVGRVLDVPAGCVADGQRFRGRVDCVAIGGGLLVYMQLASDPSAEELASIPASMQHNLEQGRPGSTWSAAPTACTMEGRAATCWRFSSPTQTSLSAFGEPAGVPVLAQCTWEGTGAMPAPCDQLLGGG